MRKVLGGIIAIVAVAVFVAGFGLTVWPLFGGPAEAVLLGALGLPLTVLLVNIAEAIDPTLAA